MKQKGLYILVLIFAFCYKSTIAQDNTQSLWHGIERTIRYQPEGEDFVIVNGNKRFNRALYGTNTAFRVEAGDLPEFALYMPGMGGNLKFGLIVNDKSEWLIDAAYIKATYRPGSMLYEIKDSLLGNGTIHITVLALANNEGIIVKAEAENVPANTQLLCAFGGASGTKFSRDGDIGADPESSFYLKPEYCKDNLYQLSGNAFTLSYGLKKTLSEEERYEVQHLPQQKKDSVQATESFKKLQGTFPSSSILKIVDASQQSSPLSLYNSTQTATPVVSAKISLSASEPLYFLIQIPGADNVITYAQLPQIFNEAEDARKKIANRIKVNTPDAYINTLGGALSIAADAIWEDPSYMHGAVAWRMRLPAWRGPYAADVLGWHDRARKHFSSYALSQVTTPLTGPVVADTALHLARQLEKMGTSLFSSGYISRNPGGNQMPHHYDMNLVFVDELLNHFSWTGDTAYVKQMWPLLKRHLAWEKRNFDKDSDGLYDAYAAIWASDALQYSGGGVTHSSAYNYRANKVAAELATLIGEDAEPYKKEADKILKAINSTFWMPSKGWFAEYKDLLGLKQLHPQAAIWTIYHSLDSKTTDAFQSFQCLKYVDTQIPRIPVRAKGLADTTLYTISTTNWQPYTWSLNNVALAEVLHTSLAYWQGGRNDDAYKLWKSALVESMYLGSSPGNFEQISFYDAIRGELYRDFADPIGMAARSLVEGLFGISPDALHGVLRITPGFPSDWYHASLTTPDIDYSFVHTNNTDKYTFTALEGKRLALQLNIKARTDSVASITVNGKDAGWHLIEDAIETPILQIDCGIDNKYEIEITWKGRMFDKAAHQQSTAKGEKLSMMYNLASIQKVYDPQKALNNIQSGKKQFTAIVNSNELTKTIFIKLQQGQFAWWQPVSFKVVKPVEIIGKHENGNLKIYVQNNTATAIKGSLIINDNKADKISLKVLANDTSSHIDIPSKSLVSGTNHFAFTFNNNKTYSNQITDWDINNEASIKYDKIDLGKYYNDNVTNIFRNQYLSPRPNVPTLQLPTQGIGNWCYPLTTANIDDAGLRKRAGNNNQITIKQGVPFNTPSQANAKNIAFTSMWNNYPHSVKIPLNGKASHAYFLMAGSTDPMQSRFTNGEVIVEYKDGSTDKLELNNPETWWPIEQDYFVDGYAFTTNAPKPVRVYLKTGEDTRDFTNFTTIKGFTNMAVDGGAATVLDLPLNKQKELKNIVVKTLANDLVIGLMSLTLVR